MMGSLCRDSHSVMQIKDPSVLIHNKLSRFILDTTWMDMSYGIYVGLSLYFI